MSLGLVYLPPTVSYILACGIHYRVHDKDNRTSLVLTVGLGNLAIFTLRCRVIINEGVTSGEAIRES